LIYKSDDNKNFKEANQRHSSYKNFFGINRQASKMVAELQFIKKEINDTLYTKTEWNYQANNFGLIPISVIDVKNQFKDPLLCGEYLLVFQKSIPWAWSKNIEKIKMPSKIIRIKIECL
jgi:antimicrobial peptide system SdpA family protein